MPAVAAEVRRGHSRTALAAWCEAWEETRRRSRLRDVMVPWRT